MSNDVKIGITGEDTGLQAALNRATESVKGAVGEMQGAFGGLQAAFGKVQGAMVAIGAMLAGGKIFKDAIQSSVDLTTGALALGKQLGISATQASVLRVALDDTHVSQEAMQTGASKITQALNSNEVAFGKLGVATRDQNGHFRNTFDIMRDVNVRLLQFKEGTDRNVEGVKIYGKAWAEVAPTLKLTGAAMDEASDKATVLGLLVGQENVDAVQRYRGAMNDVADVTRGYQQILANQLMPALTELAEWFSSKGTESVWTFREAILKVTIGIRELVGLARVAFDVLAGGFREAVVVSQTFGDYWIAMAHGNLQEASAVLGSFWDRYQATGSKAIQAIKADWDAMQMSVTDYFEAAYSKPTPTSNPKPGDHSKGGDGPAPSRMSEFEADLAEQRAAYAEKQNLQEGFQKLSVEEEKNYWQKIHDTQVLSAADQKAVRIKLADAITAVNQKKFDAEIARMKDEEEALKGSFDAQLAIAQQMAEKIGHAYGAESKEAAEAAKRIIEIERAKSAALLQLRMAAAQTATDMAMHEVDRKERQAQFEVDIGDRTNLSMLEQEQQFADDRLAIQRAALVEQLKLEADSKNLPRIQEINAQILQVEQQHADQVDAIQKRRILEQRKGWDGLFASIQSGFERTILEFTRGHLTIAGLFKGMFASVADALGQMVAKNIANLLVQTAMTKGAALKDLQASAVAAAGKAYEAMVGIPYVGPLIAPVVAAGAYAGVMAFGASAAGGYDIPASVNPITQLHEREMVLPQKHADVIRSLADEGGGRGREIHMHTHVNAVDARSFQQQLRNPRSGLNNAIKDLARRAGHLVPSY